MRDDLACAECGKTGPGTYVVTFLDPEDRTTRTEVCRECDDELDDGLDPDNLTGMDLGEG